MGLIWIDCIKKKITVFIVINYRLSIPITIAMVAYNGYTSAAKKNAIKTIHAQAVKYISAEIQKCKTGESKFMSNSQDCPATATKAVMGAVATMTDKNPFDTSKNAVREFNNNKDDKDVGFISLGYSGSIIFIKTCFDTPCKKEKNRLQDSIKIELK